MESLEPARQAGGVFSWPSERKPDQPALGFFDAVRATGLVRPADRRGPGVCAAVAHRVGVDPVLVRVALVVVSLMGGLGTLGYGIGWLLLPEADGRIHAEELLRFGRPSLGLAGACCLILVVLSGGMSWDAGIGTLTLFALLAGVVALFAVIVLQLRAGPGAAAAVQPAPVVEPAPPVQPAPAVGPTVTDPPALTKLPMPPSPPSVPPPSIPMSESPKTGPAMVSLAPAGRRPPVPSWVVALLAGLCLILAAAAIAADRVAFAAPPDHPLVWAAGSALVLIGVATVGAGLSGRRAGGLVGLAVVALLAALAVGPTRPTLSGALDTDTWGNRQWQPAGPVLADHTFRTRLGAGTIDLSDIGPLRDGAQPATITVQAELAEVQVRVPSDLTVAIDLTARGGDIGYVTTDGGTVRESTLDATIGPEGPADLRLVGNLDLASLSIVTVPR